MEQLLLMLGGKAVEAIAQIFGAKKAADQASEANRAAIAAQLSMFGITQATLQPYLTGGARAMSLLTGTPGKAAVAAANFKFTKDGKTAVVPWNQAAKIAAYKKAGWTVAQAGHAPKAAVAGTPGAIKDLTAPIKVDAAAIRANPAYQFAMSEGLKATGNALTQRGMSPLGSGAGVKGAESFASGLAAQNWQQYFQNALANKEMTWKALYGSASLGESAATGVGTAASGAGESIGTNLTNIGQAQGQGTRDIASAVGNFSGNLYTNTLLANSRAQTAPGSGGVF